ncbi:hypothetical protein NIES2119_04085 [[Phormidium ambiguum] IAM M-71]|uniref:2'-5' RNA ligase n=1 Tax=[Phormidium ambiguum] IAM M-71 TaxID=454136 RepID=A0A1U7IRN7_9CYAN|nr:hypothetical protein [Phormidium ambiguum]OKH40111.1 hypothetical protein NIES2119_04085 [Phormidium ambiguum IAM M-71]
MNLADRYQQIKSRLDLLTDFPEEELAKSRSLFHLEQVPLIPKNFTVWTCLVGLPLPEVLTSKFQQIVKSVVETLPSNTRFYPVIPANYHWELFIIKRPDELVDLHQLDRAATIFRQILSQHPPLTIKYQGFLVTTEGTIIVKGFGNFDHLRQELREKIPFASRQQSQLGHVSLGRILDPIGKENFARLKQLIDNSQTQFFGELKVSEAKYVYETQWYMEEKEVIATLPFLKSSLL